MSLLLKQVVLTRGHPDSPGPKPAVPLGRPICWDRTPMWDAP